MAVSNSEDERERWLGGQARSTKETLGSARQERRRVDSNCASSMSRRAPKETFNFCSLVLKCSSQKSGGPIGQPRRENPRRAMGMSGGRVDREASAPGGINSKDLLWFRCSARAGPSSYTMCRAAARSSGEPTKVPSSRYQALRESPGTSALSFSMRGWRVREKPSGHRGSPC